MLYWYINKRTAAHLTAYLSVWSPGETVKFSQCFSFSSNDKHSQKGGRQPETYAKKRRGGDGSSD